jgi:hypothetical protein
VRALDHRMDDLRRRNLRRRRSRVGNSPALRRERRATAPTTIASTSCRARTRGLKFRTAGIEVPDLEHRLEALELSHPLDRRQREHLAYLAAIDPELVVRSLRRARLIIHDRTLARSP